MCTGAPVPATGIFQQADSLPCIPNGQTDKIWAGTVAGALKTAGVQVSACPTVTLPPRLSRRPSASQGPPGEAMVWMQPCVALLPPSPASAKPGSFSPCRKPAHPVCSPSSERDGPWGVEGGQGSWAGLLSRQLRWIRGNCYGARAGESTLSHPTSTVPGVGLRGDSAHLHHPHPSCSLSPSSACPLTLTILSLPLPPAAAWSTEFMCRTNKKGLFVLWSTMQGGNECRFILGHGQGRAELRKTQFPTWQLQESEEQELGQGLCCTS